MNITVTLTASPELLTAIQAIASALTPPTATVGFIQPVGIAPTEGVTTTTAAPIAPSNGVAKKSKAEKQQTLAPAPAPVDTEVADKIIEQAVTSPEITLEEVREAATKVATSKGSAAVKALLDEFSAPKVSALKPEQYASFLEKVKSL